MGPVLYLHGHAHDTKKKTSPSARQVNPARTLFSPAVNGAVQSPGKSSLTACGISKAALIESCIAGCAKV